MVLSNENNKTSAKEGRNDRFVGTGIFCVRRSSKFLDPVGEGERLRLEVSTTQRENFI
jgi:hypothetical protein